MTHQSMAIGMASLVELVTRRRSSNLDLLIARGSPHRQRGSEIHSSLLFLIQFLGLFVYTQ